MNCKLLSRLALAAALFLPAITLAAEPDGKKLDLSFIPEDAVAAVVAHPHRVLTSPMSEMYPTEMISIAGKKNLGFDPVDIDVGMAVFGLPDPNVTGPNEPRFGLVLRFNKPIDMPKVAAKLVPRGKDSEVEGHKVRIDEQPAGISFVAIDDQTLMITDPPGLNWMLSTKKNGGALSKLMEEADDSPDAAAYVLIEPLRPLLAGAVAQAASRLPPPLMGLTKMPELIDTVTADATQLGQSGLRLQLIAAAPDEKKATELEKLIKQTIEFGKFAVLTQMSQDMARQPGQDPEISGAMIRYLTRISDKIIAAIQPVREGNKVILRNESQYGVAAVGVLTSLLMPAVQAAREAARRNVSQNNLKEIGLAILNYESAHKRMPAQAIYDKDGKPLLSWRVQMLPYVEEAALYQEFHLDEPWDSEHNKPLIDKMPAVYKHPHFNEPGKTVYEAVVGKGCAFEGKEGLRLQNFADGTSRTIMVVETSPDKAVIWTKPDDWELDPNNPLKDLGGLMAGNIFNALFADCHVEVIPLAIDPAAFKAKLTRNGHD